MQPSLVPTECPAGIHILILHNYFLFQGGGVTKRGKGSGYTRAYKLSPALAELMGETELPRHEVVKRVWAIIKEKQLFDPNNRQFAICDKALFKVIGTQRFHTFGMMKYLKNHFID